MEYRRQMIRQTVVDEAPAVRQPVATLLVTTEREKPEVGWQWTYTGQRVGDGHGNQQHVRSTAHIGSDKDCADAHIGDKGDADQYRRQETVDDNRERAIVD